MKEWIFIIFVFFLGCGNHSSETQRKTLNKVKIDSAADFDSTIGISEKEIYDFMKVFVEDQKISLSRYLYPSSIQCEMDLSDTSMLIKENFRKKQLTDSIKTAKENKNGKWDLTTTYFIDGGVNGSISKDEVAFMHKQMLRSDFFHWKRTEMNFDTMPSDTNNFYEFSIPLFNEKRDQVFITFESLCPGLCGTGGNLVYRKEKGKWVGSQIGWWVH